MFPPGPEDHRHQMAKKLKKVPRRMIYTSEKGAILAPSEGLTKTKFITFYNPPLRRL